MTYEIRTKGLATDYLTLGILGNVKLLIDFLRVTYLRGSLRKCGCSEHFTGLDLINVRGTT